MLNKIQKIKRLNRKDLKHIEGGVKTILVNCDTLCGGAGGAPTTNPYITDVCSPDRKLCCVCR